MFKSVSWDSFDEMKFYTLKYKLQYFFFCIETFNKLMAKEPETVGMDLIHLINALREDAEEGWRDSLLEAFEEIGLYV